jgi:hypothetical protein
MQSARVSALTTEEFFTICESAPVECTEHPALQAYIGGALDLLATLDEQTDYLETLYCTDPRELFDIPAIIGFMQAHREEYAERNAMLLLVRYFERRGGCEAGQ